MRLATPLIAIIAAASLAGCATAAQTEQAFRENHGTSRCPLGEPIDTDAAVRIGYQLIPNGDILVRSERWLEKCAPHADVSWVRLESGADVVQAFASKSIDMGLAGSAPTVKALSPPLNLPLHVVWVHDVIGASESLVSREPASDIADLKGKRIATPLGSTAHYSLTVALRNAGMSERDIRLVNLSPDAISGAWQRGDIDAAWIWDPTLGRISARGYHVMSGQNVAAAGAPTYDLGLATTEFSRREPDFLAMWTRAQDRASRELGERTTLAVSTLATELQLDSSVVDRQIKGYRYPTLDDQGGRDFFAELLPVRLRATAVFLSDQGEINSVPAAETFRTATVLHRGVSAGGTQ